MKPNSPATRNPRLKALYIVSSAALSALTISACGTTYTASVLEEIEPKKPTTGVRYYLPQDVIQLTVQIQTRIKEEIRECDPNNADDKKAGCDRKKWMLFKGAPVTEPVEVAVDLMTVADTGHSMMVDTNGVAFGKSDTIITVSEHGLLQGVNAKTQGTAGTVVQNLMKFAATASSLTSWSQGNTATKVAGTVPAGPSNNLPVKMALSGFNSESVVLSTNALNAFKTAQPFLAASAAREEAAAPLVQPQMDAPSDGAPPKNPPPPKPPQSDPAPSPPMGPTDFERTIPDVSYVAVNAQVPTNNLAISNLTFTDIMRRTALFETAGLSLNSANGGVGPGVALRRCESTANVSDDMFMKGYVSDSKVLRFGFQELESEISKRQRRNVCASLKNLDDAQTRLDGAQEELANADSRDKIYIATRKIEALRREYASYLLSATTALTDLKTTAEAKARDKGFGGQPTLKTKKYSVRVGALPSSGTFTQVLDPDYATFRNTLFGHFVAADPKEAQTSLQVFDEAALVLTVDDIQAPIALPSKPNLYAIKPERCGEPTGTDAKPCIYHRIARPIRLAGWMMAKKTTKDAAGKDKDNFFLSSISSRVVDVVDKRSIVQAIDLHTSLWTKRDFGIVFTPQGRLVSVKRDYGSSAEDASGALQQGLSGALSTYQSSLATIKSIRETENSLDLMPYQQQLSIANAQGSLALQPLQQQLAYANAQSALTSQPLAAQLADATAQLNLIKAQAALEANQEGYSATVQAQLADLERTLLNAQQQLLTSQGALAGQQITTQNAAARALEAQQAAEIQSQIQQLRNEIQLIQLRKELETIRSGG